MSGRVATVLRKYDPAEWGGAETHIVEIARRLGAEGWQNEIYAPMGPTTPDTALPASVPLRRYWAHAPFLGSAAQRRALIANAGNIISFDLPLRLAFDRSIDVAHVHTGGRIAGAVRVAMRRTGRPYVMSFHGPVFGGASFQAVDQARRNRGVLDIGQPYGVAVGARRVIDDAARVIVFNGEEHAGLSARIGSRAVQMDHGVDLARIERGDAARARRRFPALGEGPFALLIGRLALQKNQLLAIQAFAAAAPEGWSLVLAGAETDPGYRAQVEAAIRSAGLEGRVHVLGNVDGQVEIPDLLAASSLLMTPSLHEAFGLVVLEAWAAGRPTLFVRKHGLADLGDALGVPEATVPDLEVASWAHALGSLLRAPEALQRIAERGGELVRRRFTWEQAAARLARLYEEVREETAARKVRGGARGR